MDGKPKQAIYFDDYQSISDTIMTLGKGIYLKMNVRLWNKDQDNMTIQPIREYVYQAQTTDREYAVSVKRRFTSFLSIEYQDQNAQFGKGQIMIDCYNILGLRDKMTYVDKRLETCFGMRKNKLIIVGSEKFKIDSILNQNSVLSFSPTIYHYINRDDEQDPGVLIGLNNSVYSEIPMKIWKGFYYIIMTADIYGWGLTMISGYVANTVGKYTQTIDKEYTVSPLTQNSSNGFFGK